MQRLSARGERSRRRYTMLLWYWALQPYQARILLVGMLVTTVVLELRLARLLFHLAKFKGVPPPLANAIHSGADERAEWRSARDCFFCLAERGVAELQLSRRASWTLLVATAAVIGFGVADSLRHGWSIDALALPFLTLAIGSSLYVLTSLTTSVCEWKLNRRKADYLNVSERQ